MSDSKLSPKQWVAPHIAGLPRSGIRDFFELVKTMDDVVSLGIGEPDFVTPWHIREACIYAINHGYTSYTSNLGDPRLRKAICKYSAENFGLEYKPENECIVTVGVSEALDIVLRAVLSPGDEVLYHEPCYVSYAPSVRMTHAVPVPVLTREENDFVLQVEDLEKAVTPRSKVLLLNYPNNPTGAGMTLADKQLMADFAIRHDLLVLSDEIYEELSYIPRTPSIASLPGMKERTVTLNGFSKAFAMTGLRIGYVAAPAQLMQAISKIHQYTIMCAPRQSQVAALSALQKGREDGYQDIQAMRDSYDRRRRLMYDAFISMGLECMEPKGAFYAFPSIKSTGLSSEDFCEKLLADQALVCIPGTAFGKMGEGHIRCCYATSTDKLLQAFERMQTFLDKLRS